jgi:hypothetical protein
MIFDERGMPWTIRLSLGWTIILALFSAGILFVPLGLYLAYWVPTRQGCSVAFWCYLIAVMVLILVLLVPETLVRHMSPIATGVLAWIAVGGGLVWLFAAPLVLRSEIKSLYQRSWGISLPISLLLTSFFSALYLNYSVPDLAVAPSSETVPKKG